MNKFLLTTTIAFLMALSLTACGKKEAPKQETPQAQASVPEVAQEIKPVTVGNISQATENRYSHCPPNAEVCFSCYITRPQVNDKGAVMPSTWYKLPKNSALFNLNGKDVILKSKTPFKGNSYGTYEYEGNTLTLNYTKKGEFVSELNLKVEAGDKVQNIKLKEECMD